MKTVVSLAITVYYTSIVIANVIR